MKTLSQHINESFINEALMWHENIGTDISSVLKKPEEYVKYLGFDEKTVFNQGNKNLESHGETFKAMSKYKSKIAGVSMIEKDHLGNRVFNVFFKTGWVLSFKSTGPKVQGCTFYVLTDDDYIMVYDNNVWSDAEGVEKCVKGTIDKWQTANSIKKAEAEAKTLSIWGKPEREEYQNYRKLIKKKYKI